jgi:hypothetical protein
MGVCAAVREMAIAIDAAHGGDDPLVRSVAQAIATMPDWLARNRLDCWEKHVQGVFPFGARISHAMSLLEDVFEFGRLNLYAAFQPEETAHELRALTARLSPLHVALDEREAVSNW